MHFKIQPLTSAVSFLLLVPALSHAQDNEPPLQEPQVSERTQVPEGTETATPSTETSEERAAAASAAREEELARRLAVLENRINEMEAQREHEKQLPSPLPAPPAVSQKPAAPSKDNLQDSTSQLRARRTLREDHDASPRPGNASPDPTLAGFFPLGDTGTWLKLGGYVKLDAMVDSTKIGNPNKFATASIPTENQTTFGGPAQFAMIAKQSRLHLDARTPTPVGALRIVYENDFFGDGLAPNMVYNLRHFYGQIANVTVGQTWTLYLDSDAIPDTLDFAGPAVQGITRQPQVRYTASFLDDAGHAAVAIEQPRTDLAGVPTGGTARNIMPDLTAAFRLESKQLGHLHVGGVLRYLSYENAAGDLDGTVGFSTNVSGVLNVFDKDSLTLNLTGGQGTGAYTQDLSGSAAVVLASGDVHALTTLGGFVGYHRVWSDRFTSQVTYGYLQLEDEDELGPDAYAHTHYAQANLIWSIGGRFHVGGEYLYGQKTTQDGGTGHDHRGQISLKIGLF